MPSESQKQHNLMAAVANNPNFAKKVGIPQTVGEDYVKADEGRKFSGGGMSHCGTKNMQTGGSVKKSTAPTFKKGKSKHESLMGPPEPKSAFEQTSPRAYRQLDDLKNKQERLKIREDGMHKMPDGSMMKNSEHGMKEGGSVRGCGCATKGLTKGRMV